MHRHQGRSDVKSDRERFDNADVEDGRDKATSQVTCSHQNLGKDLGKHSPTDRHLDFGRAIVSLAFWPPVCEKIDFCCFKLPTSW
jgi:hypothetical protein